MTTTAEPTKQNKRQSILEAAKKEFNKHGYLNASLRAMAAQVGIQVSGLYRYFKNKEQLFDTIIEPALAHTQSFSKKMHQAHFKNNTIDPVYLEELIEVLMAYLTQYREETVLILKGSKGTKHHGRLHYIIGIVESSLYLLLEKNGVPKEALEEKDLLVIQLIAHYSVSTWAQVIEYHKRNDWSKDILKSMLNCSYKKAHSLLKKYKGTKHGI